MRGIFAPKRRSAQDSRLFVLSRQDEHCEGSRRQDGEQDAKHGDEPWIVRLKVLVMSRVVHLYQTAPIVGGSLFTQKRIERDDLPKSLQRYLNDASASVYASGRVQVGSDRRPAGPTPPLALGRRTRGFGDLRQASTVGLREVDMFFTTYVALLPRRAIPTK